MEALRLVAKATTKSVGATAEEKVAIIKRKWPFYPQSHEEHMRLPLKKYNTITQKMYIAYDYKAWRAHYSILNSMRQCAKHGIGWGGKV